MSERDQYDEMAESIVDSCRKPIVSGRIVMRDWVSENITLKRGLCGAKPEKVCHWAFEVLGMEPSDELDDLYPGTGAVMRAFESWREKLGQAKGGDHAE